MQAYEIFKTLVGFRVSVNGEPANDNKPFATREEAEAFVHEAQQAARFERYEVLPDNRVRVTCEFGSWIYGGSYHTAEHNLSRAKGVVSTQRRHAYWSVIPAHDIRREQD